MAIIQAASCSSADVQTAINQSINGDTVLVPSGTCTWNSGVTINKSITLSGMNTGCPNSCVDNTIITEGNASSKINITTNNVRVNGITFQNRDGGSGAGTITINPDPAVTNYRIDHNHFKNAGQIDGSTNSIVIGAFGGNKKQYPGLIDNNLFDGANSWKCINLSGGGVSDWNLPLGLGGSDFLFVEDNRFVHNNQVNSCFDTDDGGRVVFRYNYLKETRFITHGTAWSSDPLIRTSVHAVEVYNNTFNGDLGTVQAYFMVLEGGTGVFYNNTANGSTNHFIYLQYLRGDNSSYCTGSYDCDGSYPLDGNSGSYGYPCYQQPGMTGSNGHISVPVYAWNNTWSGHNAIIDAENECGRGHMQSGRDYFNETPKPGYIPYTYPHPLRNEEPQCPPVTANFNLQMI